MHARHLECIMWLNKWPTGNSFGEIRKTLSHECGMCVHMRASVTKHFQVCLGWFDTKTFLINDANGYRKKKTFYNVGVKAVHTIELIVKIYCWDGWRLLNLVSCRRNERRERKTESMLKSHSISYLFRACEWFIQSIERREMASQQAFNAFSRTAAFKFVEKFSLPSDYTRYKAHSVKNLQNISL